MADDITAGVIARNNQILRLFYDSLRVTNEEITDDNIEKALDFLSRADDDEQVEDGIIDRWATKLKKAEDEGGYDEYVSGSDENKAERSEKLNTGLGQRIVSTVADLFTNPTGYFEYVSVGEDGEEIPVDDVEALIEEHRTLGGFSTEVANADYCSVAVGVGPLWVDWRGGETGHLKYRAFSPSCIRAQYGASVIDNGVERGVDYTDLGDASMVSIQLASGTDTGTTAADKQQYLAIYGASDRPGYENGRYVHYEARRWEDVPDPGQGGVDWYYPPNSDSIANPLTIAGQMLPEETIPEYPFVMLRGGYDVTTDKLLPITSSFFKSILELDIEFSRIAHCAMLAARGTNWIKDPNNAGLPHTLEGEVPLRDGQELGNVGQPASNAQQAFEIVKGLSIIVAEGMNVPGYQVISGQSMPESGIALMIKTQPLIDYKARRAKLNHSEVNKLWRIERGLHRVYANKPLAGTDVTQNWVAGRHLMPEDPTAKLMRITTAVEKNFMDPLTAIMELYDLPHKRAARARLEEMQELRAEFADMMPKAQQAQQAPRGLQPRGRRVPPPVAE